MLPADVTIMFLRSGLMMLMHLDSSGGGPVMLTFLGSTGGGFRFAEPFASVAQK